jgi:hypothetical protein
MNVFYSIMALMFLASAGFVCGQEQAALTPATPAASILSNYPKLEAQAKEFGNSFIQKDFKRLAELTYPKYIEIVGGTQNLIGVATRTARQFEDNGVELLSWEPTEVTQLFEESGSLYAVVPMTMRTKARNVVAEDYDCLIGVSIDNGVHWTFVSSTCVRLKDAFPRVADKLVVCPEKQWVKLPAH